MTYHELVEKIKKIYSKKDASAVNEHLAIQFNIFGEGEGAYYVELADGGINVEPYEYFDRDILISTTYDIAIKIAEGKLDIQEEAYAGRLFAEGKLGKSQLLKALVEKETVKKAAKKPAEKKPAEKKAAAKNPAAKKPAVKKAEKPVEKPAEAPAEKPAETKAE
ncbi:MAG: SCP2 sterol-binding domain-containing protein [Lachnospiraceae bacterium]|nr:SCP2 sterol-binding domain-containing protein [Lachnospiraceae bacterium]